MPLPGALLFAGWIAGASASVGGTVETPDWNQRYGNSANTSTCDVEPIRGQPVEAWRQKFEAILLGPITCGGRVVVVVREGKERRIVSLRADNGEVAARKTLDKGPDPTALVATGGLLAVVDPEKTKSFRLADDSLRAEKTISDGGGSDALVVEGVVLVRGPAQKWRVLDLIAGKVLAQFTLGTGRPGIVPLDKPGLFESCSPEGLDVRNNLNLSFVELSLGKAPSARPPRIVASAQFGSQEKHLLDAVTTIAKPLYVTYSYLWFDTKEPASGLFLERSAVPVRFVVPPVVFGERLLGFTDEGDLIDFEASSRKYARLLGDETPLPKGAARGAPSFARGVLFHGNWALELESRRVLWCMPDVTPEGPLVPAGDGRAVVRTKGTELVGWCEPALAAAAAVAKEGAAKGGGEKSGAKKGAAAPRPRAPSEDPALAEQLAADVRGTCAAFHAVARADQQAMWLALFDRYAEFKLYDECRRVIVAAQAVGLSTDGAAALTGRLAGKNSSTAGNADAQRKKLRGEEREALIAQQARLHAAADWCAARKQFVAATVLARRGGELVADRPLDPQRALAWMPAEFPWPRDAAGAARWIEWAEALLPADARFLAAGDPLCKRVAGSAFAQETIALRSANLLLFSRDLTPAVVGPALARGEAVVASLDGLLPKVVKAGAPELLEIRLHRSRDDYLADKLAGGETPPSWSAGVYVPAERVSRFFSRSSLEAPDPLGRGLHGLMAHELTHHYLDVRWIPSRGMSALLPTMWLVEGFAEFVGEQSVEVARRGGTLDDATVMSLDAVSAVARDGNLLPLDELLGINGVTFDTKLEGAIGTYALRHTLGQVKLDRRSLFYLQSSALTFFALQRCGEAGRKGYLAMLEAAYRGKTPGTTWKELGFADAEALEKAFREFVGAL